MCATSFMRYDVDSVTECQEMFGTIKIDTLGIIVGVVGWWCLVRY